MNCVDRLKRAYLATRRRMESLRSGTVSAYKLPSSWDGSAGVRTESGLVLEPSRPSAWEALARFVERNDLPPEQYVETLLEHWWTRDFIPSPYHLASPKALQTWKRLSAGGDREALLSLRLQMQELQRQVDWWQRCGLSAGDAWAAALMDTTAEVSALVRWLVAGFFPGRRFRAIRERWARQAYEQWRMQPDKYRLWRRHFSTRKEKDDGGKSKQRNRRRATFPSGPSQSGTDAGRADPQS